MTANVLGVHGVGNWNKSIPADRAADLGRRWGTALGYDSVRVAYYAHHLRMYHQGADDDLDALDLALGGQPSALLAGWMLELGWAPDIAQGWALAPIRQLASWFVVRYGLDHAIVDSFLATFLREVSFYFDPADPVRRHATRTEIATAISAHQPRIVIAHSLGSVATYETLWANPSLRVELLVTIGSPLALPDRICPRLDPAPVNGRGRRPPGVQRWVNIADPADLVAIPARLCKYFDEVDLDVEVSAGQLFTHSATAYLATPWLRDLICTHLAAPRPGR